MTSNLQIGKATHVLGAECTFNLYRPTPDSRVKSRTVYQKVGYLHPYVKR